VLTDCCPAPSSEGSDFLQDGIKHKDAAINTQKQIFTIESKPFFFISFTLKITNSIQLTKLLIVNKLTLLTKQER